MKRHIVTILCLLCCGIVAAQPSYTLDQLVDSALKNNLAVRSARLDIDAARQQRREALTKYFPNVSATGLWFNANRGMAKMEVDPSGLITPSMAATLSQMLPAEAMAALSSPVSMTMMRRGTMAGITALQPLFAGGQIVNGNRLARVGEDVSRLQLQLSENDVERQTTQYYWQLVSLQEKMNTIRAVEALLTDINKDVETAVAAGLAMRNDLLQVQLRRNDVASQRLKLENGIELVQLLLAQYCGLSQGVACGVDSIDCAAALQESAGAEANASRFTLHASLGLLPEYQLLEKQVEAARLQKRLTVGQQLPTVAVGAGYNYHNMLDNDRTFGMVFATVSIPISDWWGGSHAIKRKALAQQQAIDQLNDNAQLLEIRMQKARNDVEEARQQLLLAQRSIEQAGENLRLNRSYYLAGTCTMSDLLEAQLLYQQTLDQRVDAFAALQNARLDYRQATGQ